MKKIISIIISALLFISPMLTVGAAGITARPSNAEVQSILDVMEIMTYNSKGNFNENQYVTRAALAKILVSSSQYKGSVSSSLRISPFSDVTYTHWGAPYISVASTNKFMTGYANGTFRPNNNILYEEAVSAILKLLGYTKADYTGAYPYGQLAKANDIGLTDDITIQVGKAISRKDMANLIYNMLNIPAKNSTQIYAETLGYSRSSEILSIEDVLDEKATGPITVKSGTLASINLKNPKVYRDGISTTLSSIELYDVIYYSVDGNSIWAYSQKISGMLTAINPNKQNPTSINVAGTTYPLNYYAAQRAFALNGLETNKNVTLLLDKNGNVYDAYYTEIINKEVLGNGPITVKEGTIASLNLVNPKIYRNGISTSLANIELYDVIYFSREENTIWAYSQKVSGTLNSIAPNKQAPTSINVAGATYALNYYTAQNAFALNGLEPDNHVTLLLDKNGNVCDAYYTKDINQKIIGNGPITIKEGTIASLNLSNPKVYRNGASATLSDIQMFDVIYFSREENTIWVYSQKVSGTLNSISPNKQAPASVNVSGVTYQLNHFTAQTAFGLDGLNTEKNITLLFDKNGNVCDAYYTDDINKHIIGTGPITVKPGTLSAIALTNPKIYRNGMSATLSDIEMYDVIYCDYEDNTIIAYSQKVSGVLNAISPNKEAPTSVTVSGITYPINHYTAQRAFGLDGLVVGRNITMLLDKNGEVFDAYYTDGIYTETLGVVTDVSAKTITATDGTKTTNYYTTILMLDGSTIDIIRNNDSTNLIGKAVSVDFKTGAITSIAKGSGSNSAYINATSYTWGLTPIARNVKIIEIDNNGNMISLALSRLDGVKLTSSNILLSSTNSSGEIEGMIIKDVTGDMHKYGIITSVDRNSVSDGQGNSSPSKYVYHYDFNGTKGSVTLNGVTTSLSEGPCVFIYDDGEIKEAKNLQRATNVTSISPSHVTIGNITKHKISTDVIVYKIIDDNKVPTTIDEAVSHNGTIWIYYDNVQSEGGLVRVIYLK